MKMQSRNLRENSKRTSSQLQYSPAWEVQCFDSLEGNITCDCSPSVQKRQLLQRFLRNMFCCLKGIPPCSLMQSISCYRRTMAVWSESTGFSGFESKKPTVEDESHGPEGILSN